MTPDELRALADRVRYAATFLLRPGTPSIYWNACNRAADYLRLQAHTHPAPAEQRSDGWQLVPVVPTKGMNSAGLSAVNQYGKRSVWETYRAMLAAAPAEPKREPLSGDGIACLWSTAIVMAAQREIPDVQMFARLVERAHGIGGSDAE